MSFSTQRNSLSGEGNHSSTFLIRFHTLNIIKTHSLTYIFHPTSSQVCYCLLLIQHLGLVPNTFTLNNLYGGLEVVKNLGVFHCQETRALGSMETSRLVERELEMCRLLRMSSRTAVCLLATCKGRRMCQIPDEGSHPRTQV